MDNANQMVSVRPWKVAIGAIALWLVGCTLTGVIVAGAIGEHGSAIFAMIGLAVGIAGALTHSVFLFSLRFRRQSIIKQSVLCWFGVILVLVVGSVALALTSSEVRETFKQWLIAISMFGLAPTLFVAFLFNWVIHRVVNRQEA
jgi:uncharacterized membrane-anchored protein